MAVCRKSSDATNVRWAPCASDQGPGRDSSRWIGDSLRDIRQARTGQYPSRLSRPFGASVSSASLSRDSLSSASAIASRRSARTVAVRPVPGSTAGGGGGRLRGPRRPSGRRAAATRTTIGALPTRCRVRPRPPGSWRRPARRRCAALSSSPSRQATLVRSAGDDQSRSSAISFSAERMIWSSSATASRTRARSSCSAPGCGESVPLRHRSTRSRVRSRAARARSRPLCRRPHPSLCSLRKMSGSGKSAT